MLATCLCLEMAVLGSLRGWVNLKPSELPDIPLLRTWRLAIESRKCRVVQLDYVCVDVMEKGSGPTPDETGSGQNQL